MSDIGGRIYTTKTHVTVVAKHGRVQCQVIWERSDEDADSIGEQISQLLATMPKLIRQGVNEVVVRSAMEDLDAEHEKFFAQLGDEQCEGEPDDE